MYMSCSVDMDVNVMSWGLLSMSFCVLVKKVLVSLRVLGLMVEYVCFYGLVFILKYMFLR